jgi:prophage tail gpP-like protein
VSDKTAGRVELRFESGDPITAWESFTLRDDYTDPLGSFSFIVKPPKNKRNEYRNKLAKGQRCSIYIDAAKQATCVITTQEQTVDRDGYGISVEAKGLLVTAYEGSVDPYVAETFQTDSPVVDVILSVLGNYGFDMAVADTTGSVEAISGKSLVGRAPAFLLDELKHKDVQAGHGDQAYGFCARILSRLGVCLRTNQDGVLLIGAPDYEQSPAYTISEGILGGDQAIGRISVRDTNDGQFSETLVFGKGADRRGSTSGATPIAGVKVAGIEGPSEAPFADTSPVAMPDGRHLYSGPWKPRYMINKRSRDAVQCYNVAFLTHGATARRAYAVQCTVSGLVSRSGGRIWTPDTVAQIQFGDLDINEPMWLLGTVKSGNRSDGQQTALTFIPLNSLVFSG